MLEHASEHTHTLTHSELLNIYLSAHAWGSVNISTDFLALWFLVGFSR